MEVWSTGIHHGWCQWDGLWIFNCLPSRRPTSRSAEKIKTLHPIQRFHLNRYWTESHTSVDFKGYKHPSSHFSTTSGWDLASVSIFWNHSGGSHPRRFFAQSDHRPKSRWKKGIDCIKKTWAVPKASGDLSMSPSNRDFIPVILRKFGLGNWGGMKCQWNDGWPDAYVPMILPKMTTLIWTTKRRTFKEIGLEFPLDFPNTSRYSMGKRPWGYWMRWITQENFTKNGQCCRKSWDLDGNLWWETKHWSVSNQEANLANKRSIRPVITIYIENRLVKKAFKWDWALYAEHFCFRLELVPAFDF